VLAIRKRYLAAAILLLCGVAIGQPDEFTFGLVISIDGELIAYFSQSDLPVGAELDVVESGGRLSILGRAELTSKTALVLTGSNAAFPYLVGGEIESFSAIVLLKESTRSVVPASSYRTSSCASSEGIHHSVWVSSSEGETRIWSAYQQLGYSVEPTCSVIEFAE
jgi:hypothetical protein